MHIVQKILFFLIGLLLLPGCASDNVVSNSIIQKRKYTNGYHIWGHSKKQTSTEPTATITYIPNTLVRDSIEPPELLEDTPLEIGTVLKAKLKKVQLTNSQFPIEVRDVLIYTNDSIASIPPANSPYAIFSAVALAGALVAFLVLEASLLILLFLTAIVLAFAARQQIKTTNGKYKAPSFVTLILVFGVTFFLLIIGLIAALLFLVV